MSEKRLRKEYSHAVLSAVQQDELLRTQAEEIRKICDQKNTPPFEVAFFVVNEYKKWRKHNSAWGFNFYIYNLIQAGRIKYKKSSLKLAYKVATCFPDLIDPSKRILPFNSYREIVNTKLDQAQMNELRQEAEEYKYSGGRIRKEVKKILNEDDDFEEAENFKSFQRALTYNDKEEFLNKITKFLEEPDFPKPGTRFLIKKIRR